MGKGVLFRLTSVITFPRQPEYSARHIFSNSNYPINYNKNNHNYWNKNLAKEFKYNQQVGIITMTTLIFDEVVESNIPENIVINYTVNSQI